MKGSARKTALFLLLLTVIPDAIFIISLCTGYIIPNQNLEKYGIRWNIFMLDRILSPYSMFILWVGLWVRWLSEKDMERFFKIIWSVSIIEYFAYYIFVSIYFSKDLGPLQGLPLLFIPMFLSFVVGSLWVWIRSKYFNTKPIEINETNSTYHYESSHLMHLQMYYNRLYTSAKIVAGFGLLLTMIITILNSVLFESQITLNYIAGSLGAIGVPCMFYLLSLFPLFILRKHIQKNSSENLTGILMGGIIAVTFFMLLQIGSYCYVLFLMVTKFKTFSTDFSVIIAINTFTATISSNSFVIIPLCFILTYIGYEVGLVLMKKQLSG